MLASLSCAIRSGAAESDATGAPLMPGWTLLSAGWAWLVSPYQGFPPRPARVRNPRAAVRAFGSGFGRSRLQSSVSPLFLRLDRLVEPAAGCSSQAGERAERRPVSRSGHAWPIFGVMPWTLLVVLSFLTGLLASRRWPAAIWPIAALALGVRAEVREPPHYDMPGFGYFFGAAMAIACVVAWGTARVARRLFTRRGRPPA